MSKSTKKATKLMAIVLSMLMVISVLPMQVFANAYNEKSAQSTFLDNFLDNPSAKENEENSEILYEVTEKRDEFTKVYKKSDGSYTAVISQTPLHFMQDGEWKEINNTLTAEGSVYKNISSLFNVVFPKEMTENSQISIENGENKLAFAVNDINPSGGVVENSICESDTEVTSANNAIADTQSSVTYSDVDADTDIQYLVLPNSIKENVIVSDKDSVKDTYSFTVEKGNLNYTVNSDGSIIFTDTDGNVKFTIPKPVMTDSALAFSYDIGVQVVDNNDGTIELRYSPSKAWTDNDDRVYPITIDPAILIEAGGDGWVEDTCVIDNSDDPTDQDVNYYDDYMGIIAKLTKTNENGDFGRYNSEIYTKIHTEILPTLDNAVITDAQYILIGASSGGKILAKENAEPCDIKTVTYNTRPAHSDETFDYYIAPFETQEELSASNGQLFYTHFNITKPLNKWLNREPNNGFVLYSEDEGFFSLFRMNGFTKKTNSDGTTTTKTYSTALVFDYVDISGVNSLYDYHSQSAGRAGTGYVNDFTGKLSAIRNDISLSGNIMPVDISMTYNSAFMSWMKFQNTDNYFPNGKGWLTNYQRYLMTFNEQTVVYFTETGSEIDFILQKTENGYEFTERLSESLGESGYSLEIEEKTDGSTGNGFENYRIIRPDGSIERFNSNGMLSSVENPKYPEQSINIAYIGNGGPIDYVTDGVGRKFDFVYDERYMLSKICCLTADGAPITAGSTDKPLEVKYSYTDNLLTAVTYADGKSAHYTYDSNDRLATMENIDGYRVSYTYDENGRVTAVKEQAYDGASYVDGNCITFEPLSTYQVKITDPDGKYEIYQFNHLGKLMYTLDSNGNYCSNNALSGNSKNTYFTSSDGYQLNSENLLKNPSFEAEYGLLNTDRAKYWENSNSAFNRTTSDDAHTGEYVYTAERTTNATVMQKQTLDVKDSGAYTFSAYVKSDDTAGKMYLQISALDGSNTVLKTESVSVETTGGKWQRYSVTVDAPNGTAKIQVQFGFNNSMGRFYVDDVQLEHANGTSSYNYIENGSFTNETENWTSSSQTQLVDEKIFNNSAKALKINGGVNSEDTVYTTVTVSGKKGDVLSLGGWFKGDFMPSENINPYIDFISESNPELFNFTNDRFAQLELAYRYSEKDENGETQTLTDTVTVPFARLVSDWQFADETFALKGDCNEVTVLIRYAKNANPGFFANIKLTKESEGIQTLPPKPVVKPAPEEVPPENLEYCVCGENCHYGAGCECKCLNEASCTCSQCKKDIDVKFDEFGNLIYASYTNVDLNKILTMLFSRSFTSTGNYQTSQTNASGNTTYYSYNEDNGMLNSVTDARNSVINYTYNEMGVMTKLEKVVSNLSGLNASGLSTGYGYTDDKISSITRNGFTYFLDYNMWGNVSKIYISKIGSLTNIPIAQYNYYSGNQKDLVKDISYGVNGNCGKVCYYYNELRQIVSASYDNGETMAVVFEYDDLGNLKKAIDNLSNRTIFYYDDGSVSYGLEREMGNYYAYVDDDGNSVEKVNGKLYSVIDRNDDSPTIKRTDVVSELHFTPPKSNKNIGIISEKDKFFREKTKTVMSKSTVDESSDNFAFVNTDYTYKTIGQSETTRRIDTLKNTVGYGSSIDTPNASVSTTYSYDYDVNGNIINEYEIVNGTKTLRYRYTYDEADQLVRVDDNVNHKTFVYQYNKGGNRVSTKEYSFTLADTLGAETKTVNALYANLHWEDTMTSYGGKVITYDTIGNVTSYDGWKYTWENRQLRECKNDSTKVTYYYDFNGLRSQKTVYDLTKTNAGESYSYIWKDDKISHVEYSSWDYEKGTSRSRNEVKIVYDGENPVGMIVVSGSSNLPLTSEYLFTTNMQGDITGIVDENGNMLVEYFYDPWGNVTYTLNTDSSIADLVRKLNPFTYRGYNYDYETGLYYLQSRYYNPQWGRFMSSDIYLETGTGVLGSNVFAYCDNDPVNNEDPTGHWGEDVHRGYWKTRARAKDKCDYYTCDDTGIYVPTNKNGDKYGTYFWARTLDGNDYFTSEQAKIIADSNDNIDALHSPVVEQCWHFNTCPKEWTDSRIMLMIFMLASAFSDFEEALSLKNEAVLEDPSKSFEAYKKYKMYSKKIEEGLKYLGYALHPLQDYYAHTDDRVFKITIPINTATHNDYSNIIINEPLYVTCMAHSLSDGTDSALKRWNQLIKTRNDTIRILTGTYNVYQELFVVKG